MGKKKVNSESPKRVNTKTFLDYFKCTNPNEDSVRFCFILGAGASKQSGIPTGSELANKWLGELGNRYTKDELDRWAHDLSSKGLEWLKAGNAAQFYPEIYDKRFEIDPQEGYGYLESKMGEKDPSVGYSILAQILANTRHNVVITTNFDTLIEDALFIFTRKRPLMCGHEALASYVRPFMRRPIIAKIHRDILLAPKNTPEATKYLEKSWKESLAALFDYYTPIVIGYAGNDGSLMDFLKELEPVKKKIIWCFREEDGSVSDAIKEVVIRHKGYLVPIVGFDEIMVQLNDALEFPLIKESIIDIARNRVKNFTTQVGEIIESLKTKNETQIKESLESTIKKQTGDWLPVELMALSEEEPAKKDKIYQKGLKNYPKSAELKCIYALFLEETMRDITRAEAMYREAIETAKEQQQNYGGYSNDYAKFLEKQGKLKEAEEKYNDAIQQAQNDDNYLNNYGHFLENKTGDLKKAEEKYKLAVELNPDEPEFLCNYARILLRNGNKSEGQKYIEKALSLNDAKKSIKLELWFYIYALIQQGDQKAYKEVNKLTQAGVRVKERNLSPFVEMAIKGNHPKPSQLKNLARQISETASARQTG